MKYLWLLRHAKAASDPPRGGGDMERPLTARGRRDATALGRRLGAGEGVFGLRQVALPEVALCSAAVRTRQTAELVNRAMGDRLPLDAFRSLYGATTETTLRVIQEIDDDVRSALMVGHNPTIYRLVWELVSPVPGSDVEEEIEGDDRSLLRAHGFPTCALAVVALEVETWQACADGRGSLAGLFKPPY
ncbi:MAG: SixA phosphatase family protein [Acidimicrobiales bacterium]